MKLLTIAAALILSATIATAQPIDLQWVGGVPKTSMGTSWGVPFTKGEIQPSQNFTITNASGETLPLQSWVMARHADGSVKWMGFATAVNANNGEGLKLDKIVKASNKGEIMVSDDAQNIVVVNGKSKIKFNKTGRSLISSIEKNGKPVAQNGVLMCRTEDRSTPDITHYDNYTSEIKSVVLEQRGPVRAVIKIEGVHKNSNREWLPFIVRFYVYSGSEAINMTHTIIYDGDQQKDFIKGLGVEFDLPFREQIQNRHVRFSGEEDGIWNEPIQPLMGRRVLNYKDDNTIFTKQVDGERIPNKEDFDQKGQYLMTHWASWNDFSLAQLTPDGFTIRKRTNDQSTWIGTFGSNRAGGLVLAGDVSGGLAVSLKNFWQSYPAELEACDMRSEKGKLKVWMWSPRAEAMDLRHYDTIGHDLEAAYEDYQEGMSTPYGVGRTSELTIYPYAQMPSKAETVEMSHASQGAKLLMATPEYLHKTGAFGVWSLPDTIHASKRWIESQIDGYIDYYQKSIENHKWYGFWNYGDVMHSYNKARHMWNYDIGGCAWANTELSPDLWLWYAFIRSSRADILTMAMAMTRHTSEVDVYHIGEMAGLGTRHNVSHWGCGAKEARIGQAWWKRFYYYLTTDDRIGDLMHEAVDADYTLLKWDPLRVAQPRDKFPTTQPTRLRWGPDWIAFAGNWYTEWERTGNQKYLDKIKTGMDCLAVLPNGLYTGKGPLGYDPETGKIIYEGEKDWVTNSNHLANLMGGFEVMMELYDGIGHKKFNQTYLQYAKYYGMPQDDPTRNLPANAKYKRWWGHFSIPRLGAFPAREMKDDHLAEIAWKEFFRSASSRSGEVRNPTQTETIETPETLYPIEENPSIGTNGTAQWNLNAIILLELIGDKIPSIK